MNPKITTLLTTALLAAALMLVGCGPTSTRPAEPKLPLTRVAPAPPAPLNKSRYKRVADLSADADLVVTGRVASSTPLMTEEMRRQREEMGKRMRQNPLYDPIPPIDYEQYLVKVEKVIKSKGALSRQVTVVQSWFETDITGREALALEDGQRYLLFLRKGGDGRYYPVAQGLGFAAASGPGSRFQIIKRQLITSSVTVKPMVLNSSAQEVNGRAD